LRVDVVRMIVERSLSLSRRSRVIDPGVAAATKVDVAH
jgi:hypothetical protein